MVSSIRSSSFVMEYNIKPKQTRLFTLNKNFTKIYIEEVPVIMNIKIKCIGEKAGDEIMNNTPESTRGFLCNIRP